uniref:Uncharacterized protein n=1 Tax=Oryza brachyantha TaxID=4533 RepID=J3M9P0_ORYBR
MFSPQNVPILTSHNTRNHIHHFTPFLICQNCAGTHDAMVCAVLAATDSIQNICSQPDGTQPNQKALLRPAQTPMMCIDDF